MRNSSFLLLSSLLLGVISSYHVTLAAANNNNNNNDSNNDNKKKKKNKEKKKEKRLYIGQRDRFWRHHVDERSLVVDDVNHYENIEKCLTNSLTSDEWASIKDGSGPDRQVGVTIKDEDKPHYEKIILIIVKNAILPTHAKAIQSLASCVREYIPSLYESRAMYQEFNLKKDPGLGGNCPTHLAPLVPMFLPEVATQMHKTLEFAYEVVGWEKIVKNNIKKNVPHFKSLHPPDSIGYRASEHLTYSDFPKLAPHHDGAATAYTMNYAFSGPDDYEGGEFYILTSKRDENIRRYVKPNQYDAVVFLGGRYQHGVDEITSGHREMFSSELWGYPDTPFGSTLWTNTHDNIEKLIKDCNKELREGNTGKCHAQMSAKTEKGLTIDQVRSKYDSSGSGGSKQQTGGGDNDDNDDTKTKTTTTSSSSNSEDYDFEEEEEPKTRVFRPNRVHPEPLKPIKFEADGKEYDLETSFLPSDEEPDFLIPSSLEPGEMIPIRWRDTLQPVDGYDGESFVIGFPPELKDEFQAYVEKSGMMDVAHTMLYEETPLKRGEQRVYTLADGHKWSAMIQGSWDTDMVWLDPADEECFESLLALLGRGGFDVVLDKLGKAFDLDGLMVQGVGAIYVSEYEKSRNLHNDIPGSKGAFYNVIVPVHIPINQTAKFYVAESDRERKGTVNLNPDVGVVMGGESVHGTGECNYRETKDFRLSFAVYVADIKENNIDLIASDSTSLWPTGGDADWFRAQQGRVWSRDGTKSLKNDVGRKPFEVKDLMEDCPHKAHLCEMKPKTTRLKCPKTCRLYLEDDEYYSLLKSSSPNANGNSGGPLMAPVCSPGDEGKADCAETVAETK